MPPEKLPDPTNKTVLILVGNFVGQEGFCLGPAGEDGVYAVTPNSSNQILRLRFDEEFGIVINPGQERGRN